MGAVGVVPAPLVAPVVNDLFNVKWAIIQLYHGEKLHGAWLEVSMLAVTSPMYLKNNM